MPLPHRYVLALGLFSCCIRSLLTLFAHSTTWPPWPKAKMLCAHHSSFSAPTLCIIPRRCTHWLQPYGRHRISKVLSIVASHSKNTWALTFENSWKLLTLGGPASFALLAQDPHDTEAMSQLRQALQDDFFCRDLRHVNPREGSCVCERGGGEGRVVRKELRHVNPGLLKSLI